MTRLEQPSSEAAKHKQLTMRIAPCKTMKEGRGNGITGRKKNNDYCGHLSLWHDVFCLPARETLYINIKTTKLTRNFVCTFFMLF